jgi:phosphoribosylformylglycinamidine synthase
MKEAQNFSTRISVSPKPAITNPRIKQLMRAINEFFDITIEEISIDQVYSINKQLSSQQLEDIAQGPLIDPILEESRIGNVFNQSYDWTVEIGFKPGLTDSLGKTAQLTIEDFLGMKFSSGENVKSSTQYHFKGNLTFSELKQISEQLLANSLVEDIFISKNKKSQVEDINVQVSDNHLLTISKDRYLALNLKEMQAIRDYFSNPQTQETRIKHQLSANPTDVEIEAIAQTWSEHCKHKIFNAKIKYTEEDTVEEINSLFKTYIKGATDQLSHKKDWLVSVFSDNAGIIRFNNKYNVAFKVETHNSPSALDPYGGALTGILGVNRDIMGAGMGARLLANTDVFCFASPKYDKPLPKRLLHPKRVFEGVRLGVEHGGNKSGVPTVNGGIIFDERYLGKPLVYCGTVGIMPSEVARIKSHLKEIKSGDRIIIAGGRTGKDGIHGATFSSEALHADSPTSAVQIGDPFTQKKLHDFILEARDAGLFRALTDNGAGGFSSSIGELANLSGGCEVHLDKALLKYEGLLPWEIFLSESQERMTLAVPNEKLRALKELADLHEIELVDIGSFTDSNYLHVLYHQTTVAFLSMEFLHHGVPQMELVAEWKPNVETPLHTPDHFLSMDTHQILTRLNICSRESIIRQYDHEVQGSTVIKPLQGQQEDGPGDAAVIWPLECQNNNEGLVISNGICPRYSDIDTYHMTANAIDEAIRNAVAVGCDPQTIAILDNFCWPDPIYDPEKTPDGKHKLAQLVRANKALFDYAVAFETPIISGKDSMKNDYEIGETKISVPPTLLISAIGKIPDVGKAVTMDVKCPKDWIYVIGLTKNELGASEYARMKEMQSGIIPRVDSKIAKKTFTNLFEAISQDLIASCHDCSDGGMAVALMESSFAGGYGMTLDLHSVPIMDIHTDTEILFSESASRFIVTVAPDKAKSFEKCMGDIPIGRIGVVNDNKMFTVTGIHGEAILNEDISALKVLWKKGLED